MTASLPAPPLPLLRSALESAVSRFATLLAADPDPCRHAVGVWTVGDTAAHAARSASAFLAVLLGDAPPEDIGEVAASNAAFLAACSERSPSALAGAFLAGERALLAHAAALDGDPVIEVFRGVHAPASTVLAVELAEVLVHGFDIGRAARLHWEIPRAEAALALAGLTPLLPQMLARAAPGFRAGIELRPRGGRRLVLEFADDGLRVSEPRASRVDCRLTVDPRVYLLLSYQRIGPWVPMLQGRLLPWGRRPWLAARLPSLFRAP